MFVQISGFANVVHGITLPAYLRCQSDNDDNNITLLALVRWLVPHPLALHRDAKLRPVCPTPFDINHALWTFAKTPRQRVPWAAGGRNIARQLDMFPGKTQEEKRVNADLLSRAYYDLVHVDSIDEFMNCTCIDGDSELIMQTVTLPFM